MVYLHSMKVLVRTGTYLTYNLGWWGLHKYMAFLIKYEYFCTYYMNLTDLNDLHQFEERPP